MSRSPVHLACGSGPAYFRHTAAMVHSALSHAPGLVVHWCAGPEIPHFDRVAVAQFLRQRGGDVQWVDVPPALLAGLPSGAFGTPAVWYALLLAELLPDVDRVLHVVPDAIVVDHLAPLWSTDLGGHPVGAVAEGRSGEAAARLGLDPGDVLNTGVLLLDLARQRADGSAAAALAIGRARRPARLDQDAWNLALRGRWRRLHPRWNLTPAMVAGPVTDGALGEAELAEARRRPGIRHFEGPGANKPWHLNADPAARRLYGEHRRATPWPRFAPSGVTVANVARRVVADARARRAS